MWSSPPCGPIQLAARSVGDPGSARAHRQLRSHRLVATPFSPALWARGERASDYSASRSSCCTFIAGNPAQVNRPPEVPPALRPSSARFGVAAASHALLHDRRLACRRWSPQPMRTACRSHLSKMRSTSASRPRLTTSSIRSCDSGQHDLVWRHAGLALRHAGDVDRSPAPPRDPISVVEQVRPAGAHVLNADAARRSASPRGTLRAAASP